MAFCSCLFLYLFKRNLTFSPRVKVLEVFAERPLESVFSQLIEPPTEGSLAAAKQRLCALGALTDEESLTPLGWHLACLPVDVRIGKLMLLGAIFRCLDPALTIAASLAFKSPFVSQSIHDKKNHQSTAVLFPKVTVFLMTALKGVSMG